VAVVPSIGLFFLFVRTGILPVGAESGADSKAGQDKAVQDEPPRHDQNQNNPFVHLVLPFSEAEAEDSSIPIQRRQKTAPGFSPILKRAEAGLPFQLNLTTFPSKSTVGMPRGGGAETGGGGIHLKN
jgi:hypothetical protein